jgi:mannosyltransferase OCH1-like enzyme
MIPKIIHQIWIGDPTKKPINYMNTWIKQHPSWDYMMWSEKEIDKLNLVNRDKYDYYYKLKKYHGCADIVRIEVLYKYGGIYVDAEIGRAHV